ncbi:M protein, putative [Trichomonas vaginalis G3]|uniref:M protein, putative n=1 Tax=Trichomonas vaginalis (strain ATCC PRA-98 / G3) TaxID=412133 RepID=A2E2D8_TRIV3|nr:apolipoprotein family [Trichomonas vaginalis G3]EAY13113.1 M protein, putative [Trichomonas vaginalis G3]KAI5528214.1 apolipoprotein family [Trichomonas vaginalis G3]|eukprot:XP_001325336.1 M protein [Trichomonas vaginalis G3]
MDEEEDFYAPRPPMIQSKNAPRKCKQRKEKVQIAQPENTNNNREFLELIEELKATPKSEYTIDPDIIAKDIINDKSFTSEDPQLIKDVTAYVKSYSKQISNDQLKNYLTMLDGLLLEAEKIQFQKDELQFLKLEIEFAKTDYKIFKHSQLGKETDLMENLKTHIDSIKEQHENQLSQCASEELEDLKGKQQKELEEAKKLAQQQLDEFHKFITAELTPYKSKLQSLKQQYQLAQDKDALWNVKHPPQMKMAKTSKIIKPL